MTKVYVVVPTLDHDAAFRNTALALRSAGMDTKVSVVHDKVGVGFTKTVNAGLSQMPDWVRWVCILNDDVNPMTDDWLYKLYKAIVDEPEYGLAGPSGPCRTPPQNKGIPGAPFGIEEVSHLAFFCTLIRREALEAIGGLLDRDFNHYGSDVHACWKARGAGYKPVWVRHVYVDHEVGDPIEPWATEDRQTLKRKLRENGGKL